MSLRGARKLQLAALILYTAALAIILAYIPTQSFWKRLFTEDKAVLECMTIPVSPLIGAVISVALAAVWFEILKSTKNRPLKASAVVIPILLSVYPIAISRYVTWIQAMTANMRGYAYLASLSANSSALSFAAGLPSSAAYVLMLLSLGDAYGRTPGAGAEYWQDGGTGEGSRGGKGLQTASLILFAAALCFTLLYIPTQSFWKGLMSAARESAEYMTVPVVALVDAIVCLAAAVIWFALVKSPKGRPLTASVIVLTILLAAYRIVLSPLLSLIETWFVSSVHGSLAMVSLSESENMLDLAAGPLSSAAYMLMLLSLGRGYGAAGSAAQKRAEG